MKLELAYVDYNKAKLSEREEFSFTNRELKAIYDAFGKFDCVLGSTIISTCNRTEIYVSTKNDCSVDPFKLLAEAVGFNYQEKLHLCERLSGKDAIEHLCMVGAGAESQVWGDSQIITQVNSSAAFARKCGATDGILNVVFQKAVHAAKKIKTDVKFRINSDSTVRKAVEKVLGYDSVKKVLVIGNGVMGRMISRSLVNAGKDVVMTVRQYKYGEVIIPKGVSTVMFADRYDAIGSCDAVISATSSPHHTISYERTKALKRRPKVLIDMAVPRDIDPDIAELDKVEYFNLDDVTASEDEGIRNRQISQMRPYVEDCMKKIDEWEDFRNKMEKIIYVVGIGPGGSEYMTPQALACIEDSDVIVGYTVYVDLIKDLCEGKTVRETGMKKEVDRCKIALDYAVKGKKVAFISSGDAGVYGMAGVMSEVAEGRDDVEIKVIPGITAACSGAALLGAPLIHDFAVISLSDLLTPWETIEKRIKLAADADFVISIYNPKSKKRQTYLDRAVEIISEYRDPDTPCGVVRNIGRDGELAQICTLKELPSIESIDMFSTVFVGNSSTKIINGKMVTPRGYKGV